ncbi:MAG: hypothetical protein RLZZ229_624 [Actinomycetota bacterium]|jgi:hypothetical protein
MRLSQFREYMNDEFGSAYAAVVAQDLVVSQLDDSTANQALARGDDPALVWLAICEALAVPKQRWHGLPQDKKLTR